MTQLVEQLRQHVEATVLAEAPAMVFRYHNFTDADLKDKAPPVLLFLRSGTGGVDDEYSQETDVDLVLLTKPDQVKLGEEILHSVRLFLKSELGFRGADAYCYRLESPIIGPTQLANGRNRFMMMVRCFTENQ